VRSVTPIIVPMRNRCSAAILVVCFGACMALAQEFQMQVPPPPGAIVGQNYVMPLTVTGGITPYTWKVANGDLPPGMRMQPHKGNIVGTPTQAGTYQFTVSVGDSSIPKLHIQRDFTIRVIEGLAVDWKDAPSVQGSKISGSAVVTNQTGDDFDLTVIVVAVNQYGRATALGYQHFTIPGGETSQVIPFGSAPGDGTYYVRVDAVAHRVGKKRTFRASKQTDSNLTLTEF
jgi:hypothetical protein